MVEAVSRLASEQNVVARFPIDKTTCALEDFIKWLGCYRLEEKSPPLFHVQRDFESAIQTRVYRLYRHGVPTKSCVKFVYDTANKEGVVKYSEESREILKNILEGEKRTRDI